MKNTVKTTVEIDKKLLYDVKKKLLEDNMTMKDAIHVSLQGYLYTKKKVQTKKNIFEGKHLGGITKSFPREDIYDYI
jgi:poly-D-alanine transfer protein DltD